MSNKYQNWQYWILQNLQLLGRIYGKNNVVLNGKTWQSILIYKYRLPPTWEQYSSRLLIVLPGKSKIFYTPPDRFYLDCKLRTITGKRPSHYFENSDFNDMKKQNMARFSFHLKSGWSPKVNCQKGTNLLHVIDGLYKGMNLGARETMK